MRSTGLWRKGTADQCMSTLDTLNTIGRVLDAVRGSELVIHEILGVIDFDLRSAGSDCCFFFDLNVMNERIDRYDSK